MTVRQRLLLTVVALLAIVIAGSGFVLAHSSRTARENLPTSLLLASRQAVAVSLRSDLDLRANFSDASETSIQDQGSGKYLVQGWVDLIAESGAATRQSYSCILSRGAGGDWVADNITVLPR